MRLALKMARESQQLSREQLAHMVGLSESTIRKWETGLRPIDATMLKPIADALKQDVKIFWANANE